MLAVVAMMMAISVYPFPRHDSLLVQLDCSADSDHHQHHGLRADEP
jgi:hypothetical protein